LWYVSSQLSEWIQKLPKNARNNSAQAYDQAIKQSELPARLAAVTNAQITTSPFGNNINSTSAFPSSSSAFSNTNPSTPAFGQSAFGHPTFGQPAFGQTSFGQTFFGQTTQNPSTSTTSAALTGAFGQPLNNAAPVSAFGQSLQTPSSVFGQPSAFGNNSVINTASGGGGFSAFATQPSAFSLAAHSAPTAGSAFSQPSFAQPVPAPTTTSVFGNPAPAPTSVFGTPSGFGVFPQQPQQPALQEQAPVWSSNNDSLKTDSNTHFNSTFVAPIPSMPPAGKSARTKSVFKPGSTPYDQQIPPNYKEALPKSVVQAFESQKFEWGDIPEWVPPVEVRWCCHTAKWDRGLGKVYDDVAELRKIPCCLFSVSQEP
jgi:nucleoporin NUP42